MSKHKENGHKGKTPKNARELKDREQRELKRMLPHLDRVETSVNQFHSSLLDPSDDWGHEMATLHDAKIHLQNLIDIITGMQSNTPEVPPAEKKT